MLVKTSGLGGAAKSMISKVALCIFMGILALFCGRSPCFAVEDLNVVRVGVIDYPNYIQMNDDGSVSGYAYEYLRDIQKFTGWKYEYVEMKFADATAALAAGEIDILPGNQYTDERAKLYDFSKRDMGEGGTVLCVMPDDTKYCYNDYATYDGIRIASLTGSVRTEQARKKLEEYRVHAVFSEYDTDEASKEALKRGDVDVILMSSIRCEMDYKILARINSAPLYFCLNKNRPGLKVQLDDAMEKIHLESPYYEELLDERYYGNIPIQLSFTQAEKDYIASAAPIVVAVADDLQPVEYYNSSEDRYRGVVPDSLKQISQYSGLTFQFVPRSDDATLHEQLTSGTVQMIASVANQSAVGEKWGVNLSKPYYDNSLSLVMRGDGSNVSGDSQMVLRTGYPYLERTAHSQGYTNVTYADTFTDCIDVVDQGAADLTLIPTSSADTMIHGTRYKNLNTFIVPGSYMEYSAGVAESADPRLLSVLNKSISSFTKEQRTALLVENVAVVNQHLTLRDYLTTHRFAIAMMALVVAAVITAIAVYAALSRKQANLKLQNALEREAAANRAKTDFMARMSHDMRTPMNGILGLTYLMKDQNEAEMKEELPKLREAGEYLLRLINDVLDVNKIENGGITLHPQVCDEEQLFDSIISMMRPQLEQKKIDFHFDKINIIWTYMMLDEQRVKQIFINLLSNAIKFTPEGGRIDFVMELISEDEHTIRDKFIVRDTGIGMSKEFLPRVFEPFSQENRKTDSMGGSGLGLSIVKQLVELMGGSITVTSEVDVGTEFTLYLNFPLAKKPEESEGVTSGERMKTCGAGDREQAQVDDKKVVSKSIEGEAGGAIGRSRTGAALPEQVRILLCEDQKLNAQIASRLLEKQGAEVVWKENGKLGAEAFAESEIGYFDAVLMDIRMPVMNGIEAAEAIRAMDRADAKTVPIIAMTANAYEEDVKKSLDAGMNEHLAKPVEPAKLYETLSRYILAVKKS